MEIAEYIIADDRRLVELSLSGDDMAFEYLFNRYGDAIRRLFLQRSTSVEDTEDLLQVTATQRFTPALLQSFLQ